jgi:hypothetical protein
VGLLLEHALSSAKYVIAIAIFNMIEYFIFVPELVVFCVEQAFFG